jgi:hypothetical protein
MTETEVIRAKCRGVIAAHLAMVCTEHRPLRSPLCWRCQLDARIEELEELMGTGKAGTYEVGKYYWTRLPRDGPTNRPCPALYDPSVIWYPWVRNGVRFGGFEIIIGERIPDPPG